MSTTIIKENINKYNIKQIRDKINNELSQDSDLEILITKKEKDMKSFLNFIQDNPIKLGIDPVLYQNNLRDERN